ncbi:MAG: hypothetical protein ABIH82_03625 [Candidatus Woesearchaeota archaeon]
MLAEQFKDKIKEILETEIKFEGHVNIIINNIPANRKEDILKWVNNCKLGIEKPEPCKNYRDLIAFIYKSNDNKIRGILTKEKNSYFIELFLDKHKYYDRKRKYLGL